MGEGENSESTNHAVQHVTAMAAEFFGLHDPPPRRRGTLSGGAESARTMYSGQIPIPTWVSLLFLYGWGFVMLAVGVNAGSRTFAALGALLIAAAVYNTIQWRKAKSEDLRSGRRR